MAYTSEKPPIPRTTSELRETIPGWGIDLNPADRPAFPKERYVAGHTGAHWDFPERQPERYPREKSPEHRFLTPVFGTAQPLTGLSGMIRRYAYTFSEGRLAHWLLLIGADRVDVFESRLKGLASGRPDNPIAESGIVAEVRRHGFSSRWGRDRADLKHQPLDLVMAALPWVALAGAVYGVAQMAGGGRSARRRVY